MTDKHEFAPGGRWITEIPGSSPAGPIQYAG